MIKFDELINKLIKSESVGKKCPYCWEEVKGENNNVCENCGVKVGDWNELI